MKPLIALLCAALVIVLTAQSTEARSSTRHHLSVRVPRAPPSSESPIFTVKNYGKRRRMEQALKRPPKGWVSLGSAPQQALIELAFFVKQENLDKLEQEVLAVSDPSNPRYGKHYTVEQVNKLIAPSTSTVSTLRQWLGEYGLSSSNIDSTSTSDILRVVVPISLASKMLNASFEEFSVPSANRTILRTHEYTLPEHIAPLVDFVGPTVRFPRANDIILQNSRRQERLSKKRLPRSKYRMFKPRRRMSRAERKRRAKEQKERKARAAQGGNDGGRRHLRHAASHMNVDSATNIDGTAAISEDIIDEELRREELLDLIAVPSHSIASDKPSAWKELSVAQNDVEEGSGNVDDDVDPSKKPFDIDWDTIPGGKDGSDPAQPSFPAKETDLPTVTPALLRQIYGLDTPSLSSSFFPSASSIALNGSSGSAAVTGFLEQYMAQDDLDVFFSQYDEVSKGRRALIIGENDEANPGGEASLDIQYLMSLAPNLKDAVFWSTPGRQDGTATNEPFLDFLFNISHTNSSTTTRGGEFTMPSVFSISYGDDEETVFQPYADRVNVEFQKAGLRGISFIVASGDGGVAGAGPRPCDAFVPTFPAASPWVTAVGGTTSMMPEIAASLSGGGFSNRWARPSWQTDAVEGYFKSSAVASSLPPATRYNRTGAGFPDVAAQALRFPIAMKGQIHVTDGTSASAPVFAAIISILNNVRASQGKTPLGFLNPLLYKNPGMFNDVVDGSNPGCDTRGFPAAPGWDPVTGLGTPNFPKMKKVIETLP